jgi:hypothetical protein
VGFGAADGDIDELPPHAPHATRPSSMQSPARRVPMNVVFMVILLRVAKRRARVR